MESSEPLIWDSAVAVQHLSVSAKSSKSLLRTEPPCLGHLKEVTGVVYAAGMSLLPALTVCPLSHLTLQPSQSYEAVLCHSLLPGRPLGFSPVSRYFPEASGCRERDGSISRIIHIPRSSSACEKEVFCSN